MNIINMNINKITVGIVLGIIVYIGLKYNFIDIIMCISLILGLYELIKHEKQITNNNIVFSIAIIIIVSIYFMISNNIVDNMDIIFILLIVCVSDICQELTGKYVNKKHKIGWISPNKTYEGYIGGYIGILILSLLILPLTTFSNKNNFILLNFIYILGIFGDLYFSYIKRKMKIKDYSNLLLSHGGILDRIDAFIFAIFGYGLYKYIGL